jgi:hypothetical protein
MRKRKVPKASAAPTVEAVPAPNPIPKRPTIQELEAILNAEGDTSIMILPNGEVRAMSADEKAAVPKPITMKERLGGEYGKRSA